MANRDFSGIFGPMVRANNGKDLVWSTGVGNVIVPVLRVSDLVIPTTLALAAALLASLWPAWQAGSLLPADALRRR